jgi:hypothetical protein
MAHVTRLALHVVQGADLFGPGGGGGGGGSGAMTPSGHARAAAAAAAAAGSASSHSSAPDTYALVTVRSPAGARAFQTRSRTVPKELRPHWKLSCVVDLQHEQPATAAVAIEVRRASALGTSRAVCAWRGTVGALLEEGAARGLKRDAAGEPISVRAPLRCVRRELGHGACCLLDPFCVTADASR